MSQIERRQYGQKKQILGILANKVALPGLIKSTGVTANEYGKKIVKAGTPVGHATGDFLLDASLELTVMNTELNGTNAQGVLEHDVDVTSGLGNGTVIIEGYINENRLDGVVVVDNAKEAMPFIHWIKR